MSTLPHEVEAMNLLVAGRRLELARSPELFKVVHGEQTSELKRHLERFVLEIMDCARHQFSLTWKSEWVLEIADTTGSALATLLVVAPTKGALSFSYLKEDGRAHWVGLNFTLYPSSLADYGWIEKEDEKKTLVTIEEVASWALGRLLRYATLAIEVRISERRY